MGNGLQTFLKFANLYGNPQEMSGAMPTELPVNPAPNRTGSGISVPGAYGYDGSSEPSFSGDMFAEQEQPLSALDMFKQSVMSPPQRQQMTYPKSTLNGLTEALKIAAEPSPLAKNRVWVNGKPHQKQQVRTDPVTGEKQYITNVHEPAFADQVMRAMPAAVSGSVDILNQPHEDAVTDWELKNKGLGAAAKAESDMALANQRNANAGAIPQRVAQGDRALDIRMMDAQTRQRVAQLKDLPDSEKMRLLQEGKVSLEEIKASNAYSLQELRGTQRTGQIEQQGAIRSDQIDQQGAIRSGQIDQQGAIRTGQIAQQGGIRSDQIAQQGALTAEQISQRATEARDTKAAPGTPSTTSSSHTQQKQAAINKANEIINAHPEWADKITSDPKTGMPVIAQPDDPWFGEPDYTEYDKIYEALYGRKRGGAATAPAPPTSVAAPPAKQATKQLDPAKQAPKYNQPATGKVKVVSPDGVSGTWDYSKGPLPAGFKKVG